MKEKDEINLSALRGKVVEVYGTFERFADAFGITPTQMGNKLSGKSGWSLADIRKAADLLKIRDNAQEVHRIFF